MANTLDEMNVPTFENGRDVQVIPKQIPVTISNGWRNFFNIGMWFLPPIIGGVVVVFKKAQAKSFFERLQQRVQQAASTVDNYLEQRVMELKNVAPLVEKAVNLDKETFAKIAEYRGGGKATDVERNEFNNEVEILNRNFMAAIENYPDLKAHHAIEDAIQKNSYLQREITAAREHYNDVVTQWNMAVNTLYIKQLVAAEQGYTTRIPFATTADIKAAAREVFF